MYEPENEENHRKQKRSARRFGANKEDLKEDLKGGRLGDCNGGQQASGTALTHKGRARRVRSVDGELLTRRCSVVV